MIDTFLKLKNESPGIAKNWVFTVAGGSENGNPYLQRLKDIVAKNPDSNIHLKVNISLAELKSLYQDSTLFWHLCGLGHADPSEIEHFGMTTVEAMQNKVVPLVYDGGGLKEIVDHSENGFRVRSKAELMHYSLKLMQDEKLIQVMGEKAQNKSHEFSKKKFEERVRGFFNILLRSYSTL